MTSGVDPDAEAGAVTLTSRVVASGRRRVYGWVIVAAAFFCSFVVDGVAGSISMFLDNFREVTADCQKEAGNGTSTGQCLSSSLTSLVGSFLYGVYLLMGPIACSLADTFGYRLIIFSGSLIAASGFAVSFFVNNLYVLIVTYGVIGGMGFGLIYSPSIMYVCAYFKEGNALAVGLTVCGSSVGGMVFPLIVTALLHIWHWQGTMLFLAGVALLCCVAAAAMFDPQHKAHTQPLSVRPRGGGCLPPLVKEALHDMTRLSIYRHPAFLLYSIASFIGSLALLTPIFFLPDLAQSLYGITKDTSAYTMTAVNCANLAGRIAWGAVIDRSGWDPLKLHNACILLGGVWLGLLPVCGTFAGMLVDGAVYGFFIAPYISLMAVILSSRLGPEQLPLAFGQTQLLAGIASMLGPPIAEIISGAPAFYSSGALWIVAALIGSLIFLLPKSGKLSVKQETSGDPTNAVLESAQLTAVVDA
ncbi:monocarboxylate transporter 12-like [Paramacrobiotus metropolitanus]|uniref:monocarboxylate transporter 12-like n=1 Tax=Paramacrobiotus metropolitanus TaxID=2943436 RepID=UPI00244578B7|nr:monocarboxylate transporter 12-like [Paramacrobiotus metropolitanus]XP_055344424.1 monocarboxylate transporter 12-like [Paramacrobiotus metropolitanus]